MPQALDETLVAIRTALKSQYHAALAMLRFAIEQCPDELWEGGGFINPTWRIAYHTLFYTHFYLQPTADDFTPWPHHVENINFFRAPADEHDPSRLFHPYTRRQVLDYWQFCDDYVDGAVERLDLLSQSSGFHWYSIPKLEHQFVNIRHIQHHAAQLGQRLRDASGGANSIDWVGAGRRASRNGG